MQFAFPEESLDRLEQELREHGSDLHETIVLARTKSRLRTKLQVRHHRGSAYRGVSKNGTKWQTILMVNKSKRYLGNYQTAEEAASAYDLHAFLTHGLKVKSSLKTVLILHDLFFLM